MQILLVKMPGSIYVHFDTAIRKDDASYIEFSRSRNYSSRGSRFRVLPVSLYRRMNMSYTHLIEEIKKDADEIFTEKLRQEREKNLRDDISRSNKLYLLFAEYFK